ncbi:hypothetical protein LBMAG56_46870 [Verrucomicrobiota bacterium]|nr:hypothetical protein LBMAG56_46870 [Verrucomicrobiota bacterium]
MFTLGKTLPQQNVNPCIVHRVRVIIPPVTSRLTQQILAVRFGPDKTSVTPRRSK